VRILALETSGVAGSVAALDDDNLLAELELNPQLRSARSLAPALVELVRRVGWRPLDAELVAVTIGPGSFTGLRVGVTTAKVLAYAAGAEVLGVSTLQAVAVRAPAEVSRISVGIDAQRGDVVAQSFGRGADGWLEPLGDERLMPREEWLTEVPPGFVLSGPMLRKVPSLPAGIQALDQAFWDPSAAAVGRLAARLHRAGRRDDIWAMVPRYSRRAAAEEKWEQMGK
jgi:tRNA threonylcarbamoyladenosine biosynthesis protein TsaB